MSGPIRGTTRIILTASFITQIWGCAWQSAVQQEYAPFPEYGKEGQKAFCLPVQHIQSEYRDNTTAIPEIQYSDQFLLESAGQLTRFEASNRFLLLDDDEITGGDSLDNTMMPRFSLIANDTAGRAAAAQYVADAAKRTGADLVIVPYACTATHIIYKQESWRGGKGGVHSERPTTYRATVEFHLQLWNAEGKLLFERVGKSSADKPFLHSLFGKKKSKNDDDILKSAQRFYAPPILKTLYRSIRMAFVIR